jgi:hypothetical protein
VRTFVVPFYFFPDPEAVPGPSGSIKHSLGYKVVIPVYQKPSVKELAIMQGGGGPGEQQLLRILSDKAGI